MGIFIAQINDISTTTWSEISCEVEGQTQSLMLKKSGDQFIAYINVCPHQGRRLDYAPGEFLETPDKQVVCPAHGATFQSEDGFCTAGPCAGQSLKAVIITVDEDKVYAHFD